jgi:putative membrane protein
MLPVGIIIMLSGTLSSKYLWTTNIFLGLQGLITVLFFKNTAKHGSVVFVTITIFILSYLIELIGVKTGLPFGRYEYSQTLSPLLFGVPVAISFSWFVLSVNSYWLAKYLLKDSQRFYVVLTASFLILGIDVLLEPFASHINGYWVWENGKIPFYNYISWFALGLFFTFLIDKNVKWYEGIFSNRQLALLPAVLLSVNIIQFSAVNVFGGYLLMTLAGLSIIGAVTILAIKMNTNEN